MSEIVDPRFPAIEPYDTGYMDTGDGHQIYYEQCGNPTGRPILFLHGGPGGGCDVDDRRFFNPKLWRVILFDQRGSGRSKPFGCTEQNNTWKLLEDTNALREALGIKKMVLFGGFWGSTLALIYAINNPKVVSGMVLRGIWLADKRDLDYYIRGGVAGHFPESWARFISNVPPELRNDPIVFYYEKMTSNDPNSRRLYAYEWARYEYSTLYLKERGELELETQIRSSSYISLGLMEAHYIINGCFIEDGYILKNAPKIRNIPTSIIHGRYDCVCPPFNAYELGQSMPSAKLKFTLAGHSSSEPETRLALIEETDKMFRIVTKSDP